MRTFIEGSVNRYESRQMTRRKLVGSLSVLSAIALASSLVLGQSRDAVAPIPVSTLNHVSLTTSYNQWTVMWYQKVFGMPIVYHQNSTVPGGVYILRVGAGPSYIALSQKLPADPSNPTTTIDVASRQPGQAIYRVLDDPALPHFGWGVKSFDADRLMRGLNSHYVWPARAQIREGAAIPGYYGGGVQVRGPGAGTAEFKFADPDGFPLEFSDETSCGGAGYLGEKCGSTKAVKLPDDPPPIAVSTLNHVTLVVPDVKRSLAWYQKVTDMRIQIGTRLRIGAGPQHLVLTEGSGPLAFRPHLGLGVEGFDADQIKKRLAEHGVASRVRMRDGTPELLLEDPDGAEIQLQDVSYCGGNGPLGNVCNPR